MCKSKESVKKKPMKSKDTSKAAHTIDASTIASSSDEDFNSNHAHVHKTSRRHSDKLTTVLSIQGANVTMEVDTGAELSTIPVGLYTEELKSVSATTIDC